MPLSAFHPVVARWFHQRFGEPTTPQRLGWEAIRSGRDTLIAAPTGSGKTLAAFLEELDRLFREGLEGPLPDETRVVYVSPLKALSADIHLNLAEPRREIRQLAEELGLEAPRITAAIRSGDTPAADRAAMIRKPPHILVTTPESLYLLLTAQRSREMLRTVRTVIVDEIHAVLESRRGAHLALSLERLAHLANQPVQRIGLSATMEPIHEVGKWLVGKREQSTVNSERALPFPVHRSPFTVHASPAIINTGHRRELDLGLELTGSPLEAVMSGEAWDEVYDRLTELIQAHRTTLVFVNTRRLAERVSRHLAERLGEDAVTAHHGSLSKETRLDAEERLKTGKLKALVATASLELGIDIGHVDLVTQLGTPRRISTFLQRVGRSGHTVHGTPKGRLFPLTRDELVESTALLWSVRNGMLDRLILRDKPLDVLAQQIVAETAGEDWEVEPLFELVRQAYPYRNLERAEFDGVVQMLAQGFSTRRGRRGALIHHDTVNGRIRGRRGSRMLAITSGGAIPDNADFRVVLEPEGTFIGTVNEDFAVESLQGDIFQLGNLSWRILRVGQGIVRVEDARGQPPSIPFWLGEAPARSNELSGAVSELRKELDERLDDRIAAVEWVSSILTGSQPEGTQRPKDPSGDKEILPSAQDDSAAAAHQLVEYLTESRRLLGCLPTQDTLVAERFFDEAGGMQLVIHSPFGSRVNRAWGLALRKRFCRQFNFELQAAATEDALLLSLGPQHSFPLDSVFKFLHPDTVEEILVQALLDAPMFGTHWRWNATIALAVARSRGGRKNPPQIQRMQSEDLLAAAFPDAAACLENIPGDREIPDHPLVRQTIDDCVHEIMDLDQLTALLRRIHAGEVRLVARDLPEPSPLSHEILNARPYAFLDDAPAEERRTLAVQTRRAFEPSSANDLGALDPAAIERVRDEAWPEVRDADELHDALLTSGFLTELEGLSGGRDGTSWSGFWKELVETGRAERVQVASGHAIWVAVDRLHEAKAVFSGAAGQQSLTRATEQGGSAAAVTREDGMRELLRGRLGIVGPTTAAQLGSSLGVAESDADIALAALEGEGVVLRGRFTAEARGLEWSDRRLLARIHRYTLNRLRAEIEPVTAADFMRFLFAWQRVAPEHRAGGLEGLAGVIGLLDGFELPAAAWESDVLASRVAEYDPALLDILCMMGRVAWGRTGAGTRERGNGGPIRSTPIGLFLREHADAWLAGRNGGEYQLSGYATVVREVLQQRGASFFHELTAAAGLLPTQVEQALGELAGTGLVASDSFAGLRALITPPSKRKPLSGARRRHRTAPYGIESAGRWGLLGSTVGSRAPDAASVSGGSNGDAGADERTAAAGGARGNAARTELAARALLRRYGVVFKRLLARESGAPAWRDLLMVYRRLEARGEIRGGRFVAGMSGEQFALPEAVTQLRAIRRQEKTGALTAVGGADPLNLVGIITPGDRIPALTSNRILFRDGVPVLAREAGEVRSLEPAAGEPSAELLQALVRKQSTPALRRYMAMSGESAGTAELNRPRKRRKRSAESKAV